MQEGEGGSHRDQLGGWAGADRWWPGLGVRVATERSSQILNVLGKELPELVLRPDTDSEEKRGIKGDFFFFFFLASARSHMFYFRTCH